MLQLNGKIGTVTEVTFVRGEYEMQAQETINGRVAFLAYQGECPLPGDRCRVQVVAEYLTRDFWYRIKVLEILERGDGQSTLLQRMLPAIERGSDDLGPYFEQRIIAQIASGARDKRAALEMLLDVLESFSMPTTRRRAPLKYGHYCIAIARLIEAIYADDVQTRIALYDRMANYCAANAAGHNWAESFTAVANQLRTEPSTVVL